MSSIPYTPPEFLQGQTVDVVYERMRSTAPDGLDTSEATPYWNAVRPNAIEYAEIYGMTINEAIQIAFPQWSYGEWADYHAERLRMKRKAANASTAPVTITADVGTVITTDDQLATPAAGDLPSTIFSPMADVTVGESGTASFTVQCTTPGIIGNVPIGTITLMAKPITGVKSITNTAAASGGTEKEDDDTLVERMIEKQQYMGGAGSTTDYVIWAKEVPGIGQAYCIPEWMGPGTGTVKVIVLDSNNQPANSVLIAAVQDYIDPADGSGKAPVGAIVTTVAPTLKVINLTLTMMPDTSDNRTAIRAAVDAYYAKIGTGSNDVSGGLVKYKDVNAAIAAIETITDFSGLQLNGSTNNIQLADDEYAQTGTVNSV